MSFSPPTFDQPSPSSTPIRKRRTWPWIVIPVGCLTVMLVCCGGLSVLFFSVMGAIKSTDPYRVGLERAKANEEVKQELGEPIDASYIVAGSVNLNNNDGEAELTFPISGPKGTGQVHVKGTKTNGVWNYEDISVTLSNTGNAIDLSDTPAVLENEPVSLEK